MEHKIDTKVGEHVLRSYQVNALDANQTTNPLPLTKMRTESDVHVNSTRQLDHVRQSYVCFYFIIIIIIIYCK